MQEIVEGMRRGEARLASLEARLTAVDLEKSCYQGGWKVRDCLCHISAHGQSMLRWMKEVGLPAAPDAELSALRRTFAGARGFDLNGFNDAVIARRRTLTVQELADALSRDHAQVVALLETLGPADMERPLPPGAAWPTLGGALLHLSKVQNTHLDDVEAALENV